MKKETTGEEVKNGEVIAWSCRRRAWAWAWECNTERQI